ncbi:MAG TPA: SEC-C metal-binding domain-containing protein [Thermoanaerobaculia bacterium]
MNESDETRATTAPGAEDEPPEELERELGELITQGVEEIVRTEDPEVFAAWVREQAPILVPTLLSPLPDEARRSFAVTFARALWNATPLPGNGFRPRPLPKPERNAPCPCGSGKKYKRCCAAQATALPDLQTDEIWGILLPLLSTEQLFDAVAAAKIPQPFVIETARERLEEGEPHAALAILVPLFAHPERLDERARGAVELLVDLYDETGLEEEKQGHVEVLAQRLRPPLRQDLFQQLAISAFDRGEIEEAWEEFRRAEREDPSRPSLGFVEISLLLEGDRPEEAQKVARTWRTRLRGREDEVAPELVELFDEVIADPLRLKERLTADEPEESP